jgi:hypothetical protein
MRFVPLRSWVGEGLRGSPRRAVTALILVAAVGVALATSGACAGDDCDSDTQTWGSCSQGHRLDATHWESVRLVGEDWLDFHGERTWVFDPTPLMGDAAPVDVEVDLSFSVVPNAPDAGGYAVASGNLGQIAPIATPSGWKVAVLNNTCAQYYVRVLVTYAMPDGGVASGGSCGGDGGAASSMPPAADGGNGGRDP